MNGLDRVDNNRGYVFSNVVSCCFKCNQMKGKLSVQEFLNHIIKVVDHGSC
jgi:deferrochelatase/peroxidase EfeB